MKCFYINSSEGDLFRTKTMAKYLANLEGTPLYTRYLPCVCKKRIFNQIWMVDVLIIINVMNNKYRGMMFHTDGF